MVHCLSSRVILAHYHSCKDVNCEICEPVRNAIQQSLRKQQCAANQAADGGGGRPSKRRRARGRTRGGASGVGVVGDGDTEEEMLEDPPEWHSRTSGPGMGDLSLVSTLAPGALASVDLAPGGRAPGALASGGDEDTGLPPMVSLGYLQSARDERERCGASQAPLETMGSFESKVSLGDRDPLSLTFKVGAVQPPLHGTASSLPGYAPDRSQALHGDGYAPQTGQGGHYSMTLGGRGGDHLAPFGQVSSSSSTYRFTETDGQIGGRHSDPSQQAARRIWTEPVPPGWGADRRGKGSRTISRHWSGAERPGLERHRSVVLGALEIPEDNAPLLDLMSLEELEAHLESLDMGRELMRRRLRTWCLPVHKTCWDHADGSWFHRRVDPIKMDLPDYFDVVKVTVKNQAPLF